MSSPSPDPQKNPDITYQQADDTDHVLLTSHTHQCQCNSEKCNLDNNGATTKSETSHIHCLAHHHNVLNLTHVPPSTTNHIHPISQSVHVHVHASPKTTHTPKVVTPSCNCHVVSGNSGDGGDVSGITNSDNVVVMNQVRKVDMADDRIEVSPLPPALPPRPPPRPRNEITSRPRSRESNVQNGGIRKYVFLCCACGGLATVLGILFLVVYFLLRFYTSTLGYFETIPTFVPATMLILTGLCVISLARRKNRYSYLIKVSGLCCLVCALTCVLVTITTTVIHMNRLQTLRECVYTQKTRTCTCYSVLLESHSTTDEGMRYVFDSTPDCEVIHGALYSCLRAMFGLSVSGILVCIFSCMLVYQLLSHEKKKMYWEQLELRCRSFYQQQGAPPSTHGSIRGPAIASSTYCSCCEECRYPSIPVGPQIYPWDTHHQTERFWGRVGNFYSPNPGEDPQVSSEATRTGSGWNWRRLPWSRGNSNQNNENQRENSLTYQGVANSTDSQYGFSNRSSGDATNPVSSTGSYSVLDNRPVGGVYVWGPPPPYSNPNSPARRPINSPARFHHVHHHMHAHEVHCQMNEDNEFRNSQDFARRSRQQCNKDNYENTAESQQQSNDNSESTDTSSYADRTSHTLPVRKLKKRVDISSVKSVTQSPNNKTNVKNVFPTYAEEQQKVEECKYHEPIETNKSNDNQQCRFLPRLQGVENAAFQQETQKMEPTESEVYFADVSSCCNISVRNDHDSSLYDEALDTTQKPRLISLQCIHKKPIDVDKNNAILQTFQENISSSTATEDEDYLAHRMGKKQMSTRSRLPLPLPLNDGDANKDNCNIPKDPSQNSICSSVQTPMTETTDDGSITPTFVTECCLNYLDNKDGNVRFPTSNSFLAPDAQYEIIQEHNQRLNYNDNSCNLTNTISGVNNFSQSYIQNNFNKNFNQQQQQQQQQASPKNIPSSNIQPTNRRNLGSNISALIQNFGVNHALLYGESSGIDDEIQGHGCQSDGTMDSGWQSGSEKQERNIDGNESVVTTTHKSVKV